MNFTKRELYGMASHPNHLHINKFCSKCEEITKHDARGKCVSCSLRRSLSEKAT